MSLVGKRVKSSANDILSVVKDNGNYLTLHLLGGDLGINFKYEINGNKITSLITGFEYEILDDEKPIKVEGVAPNTEIIENENGGKQSKTSYDFTTQIDPLTWLELAKVSQQGLDKYGTDNIKKISVNDNLNHAIVHIFAHLSGDKQDEHLAHACFRLLMAHSKSLWDAKEG